MTPAEAEAERNAVPVTVRLDYRYYELEADALVTTYPSGDHHVAWLEARDQRGNRWDLRRGAPWELDAFDTVAIAAAEEVTP